MSVATDEFDGIPGSERVKTASTPEAPPEGGNAMESAINATRRGTSKTLVVSWALSGFLGLFLLFDGFARLVRMDAYVEALTDAGYAEHVGPWIGVTLIACTVLYLVPRTAALGAILLTGYLGGAIATHVRVEEPNSLFALGFGVLLWVALALRDATVRALVGLDR